MLRRVELKDRWRSLEKGFWPADLPFGRATVIYGHNGSGKSTLAELLLSLGKGQAAAEIVWEHDDKRKVTVPLGGSSPSSIAVFTRAWVEANLSEFLDGEHANAIVTLGRAAIDSRDKELELEGMMERLRTEALAAGQLQKETRREVESLARQVQDRIVDELQRFDQSHYSRNRYSVVKVSGLLREASDAFPDDRAHAEALVRLGEPAPMTIPRIVGPPAPDGLPSLGALLSRTPTRVAIAELEENTRAQEWVHQGLALHEERSACLFCASALTSDRREQLARHFDESWLQIRREVQLTLSHVETIRTELLAWLRSLPTRSALVSELQDVYGNAADTVCREVEARIACLDAAGEALQAKSIDPDAVIAEPDRSLLNSELSAAFLAETVHEHNRQAERHAELVAERKATILEHIIGSAGQTFRELERQAAAAVTASAEAAATRDETERMIDRLRQDKFTTAEMADTLTRDLARVYGKEHLSIAVTGDGRSYTCRRPDGSATNLSEGERTTLSLLYFLRNLEDQQTRGVEPAQRIVIVDDPSSSLDREALFATHDWLLNTLQEFGQYVVLTHDFSLLRLFITSHNSKWNASAKAISAGDQNEIRFPRVAFRELYTVNAGGARTTKLDQLPSLLRNSTSEYAYLFAMVMKGVADSEDHERLLLLPNAARRVLETFASYKAPHRPNFLQQLEVLVKTDPGEPYRDVYDFCNRFSHGEGGETVNVLDARGVHVQIRRCMEFLRAVDGEHFSNMCEAVKVDPAVLP